ncbi:unnamed protein product, partial [Prorocentrum cordatum]
VHVAGEAAAPRGYHGAHFRGASTDKFEAQGDLFRRRWCSVERHCRWFTVRVPLRRHGWVRK